VTTDLLYIVSRLRPSGPTNQLYYILEHLDNDFNAKVLTLSPEPEDTELPRFQELGVDYETLGLSRWKGLLYGPKQLRESVSEYDPEIIQTQGIRADTLSALFLSEYPRITTVRNYPYDDYPAKFGTVQGKAMAAEHIRMYRCIDHPVACSETIRDKIRSHGVHTTPIQNGVDTEVYSPVSDTQKAQLRENLDIPETATVFVSVGTLLPRKNPIDVMKGFQRADIENSLLLMLGDGPLQEDCEAVAAENDQIRIKGWVDNVSEYLGAADYYISASRSEGLPNTVMEALASGLPVCLSDIPQHREILDYNRDAGVLFDVGAELMIANQLESLVQDNHSTSPSVPRQLVKDHLSATRMASRYQQLYRRVAGSANCNGT